MRIPVGWWIVHTDFSPGMVNEARGQIDRARSTFAFVDAMSIPHADASFDAVIANHMLYHVPDRTKAIAEFARVLKPGGRLFATTSNAHSLAAVKDLIPAFNASERGVIPPWPPIAFSLEDGQAQLVRYLVDVTLHTVNTTIEVPDADPLVAFIASRGNVYDGTRAEFHEFVREKLAGGPLRIDVRNGMFIASKRRDSGLPAMNRR